MPPAKPAESTSGQCFEQAQTGWPIYRISKGRPQLTHEGGTTLAQTRIACMETAQKTR
jgi:hypothetical protein